MAVQNFGAGFAIGLQADADTINGTISALSGALNETDGIVLGVAEAGTGETGITLPNFVREQTELAKVPGSFTRTASSFKSVKVDSFDITWLLKGNGVTSSPSAGQAKPLAGIDALIESAGLDGANGTNPLYTYTPSTGTTYATIKVWTGEGSDAMSFVFKSCLVESMSFAFAGNDNVKVTSQIRVGSVQTVASSVTLPTFDYGTQSSLIAPVVQGVGFEWGETRGFQTLSMTVTNTIEEIEDSNQSTGLRLGQTDRSIELNGVIYVDDGDTDFEYATLSSVSSPVDDATFQVGTIAGGTDTINAFLIAFNNGVIDNFSHDKLGELLAANVNAHATATGASGEFAITFN